MTTSSPKALEDFVVDSRTSILPTYESSDESVEDMSNDMLEVANTMLDKAMIDHAGACNDGNQNNNNICYEGISQSPMSKKARTDAEGESSLSVVDESCSSTTKNTTVLEEADFNYFDDITKHGDVAKDILREHNGNHEMANANNECLLNHNRLYKMSCENYYLQHQRCKKILLSMCIGMTKHNQTFLIEKQEVCVKCSNVNMKKMFMPNKSNLVTEIVRRFYNEKQLIKKCKSWKLSRCKDWLVDHPVTNLLDIEFLLKEEGMFSNITKESNDERDKIEKLISDNKNDSWYGLEPWLRLYHCMLEEEVLEACKNIHKWADREGTDGRNSIARRQTFFELCSNKFNDPQYKPYSLMYPDLHDDFIDSIPLFDTEEVKMPLVTPGKIKDQLVTSRCKVSKNVFYMLSGFMRLLPKLHIICDQSLNFLFYANETTQALVVISKWEQSGNGSGQRTEDDDEYGHVVNNQLWLAPGKQEFMDGDNRKNFLRDEKSHILYFWQLIDENDLLAHSLAKLSDEVRVDSDNVPNTMENTKICNNNNKLLSPDKMAEQVFKESVSSSFHELARSNSVKQCMEIRSKLRKFKREMKEALDEDEEKDIKEEILYHEKLLATLNKDLNL